MKITPVRPFFNHQTAAPKGTLSERLNQHRNLNTLAVEIGCGAGKHPILFAKEKPDHLLIALERTKEKFQSFQQRINNHPQINSLIAVNEDAHDWLPRHIPPLSVSKYFLLYPNPYPKESQANKRWHRSSFMYFILETLRPGGEIELATNELFYFEEAKIYFSEFWKLPFQEEVIKSDSYPRTHFEKKYLLRGETCYNLVIRKV